jgi:regulator of sigma E protease
MPASAGLEILMTLITIIVVILVIVIIIMIHEAGHYLAAFLLNIKITEFSIGFGFGLPPIYQRTLGNDQTLFSIYPIPLGGSISFFEWHKAHEKHPDPLFHFCNFHRAINKRTLLEQHLVAAGGVISNALFAIIIYTCVFTVGIEGERPVVGSVTGIASQMGLLPGDEITHIHGQRTMRWDAIINLAHQHLLFQQDAVTMTVMRQSKQIELLLPLHQRDYNQTIQESFYEMFGITPYTPPIKIIITDVHTDSPAATAGLQTGDIIYEANSTPIKSAADWADQLNLHLNKSLNIKVLRNNTPTVSNLEIVRSSSYSHEIDVTPKLQHGRARLGIAVEYQPVSPAEKNIERYSLLNSIAQAIYKVQQDIIIVFCVLWKIFTFQTSFLNLNGLFTLYRLVQHTLQDGICYFLMLVATINSSIAVSNLLPLYPLDGNSITRPHLQFILGKRYNLAIHQFLDYFGLSVVALLVGLSIISDLIKWN